MQGDIDEAGGRDSDRTDTNVNPPRRFSSNENPPPPEEQHALHNSGDSRHPSQGKEQGKDGLKLESSDRRSLLRREQGKGEGRKGKRHRRDNRPTGEGGGHTHKGHAPNGADKHQGSPPVEGRESGPQRRETAKNGGVRASAEERGALKTVQSWQSCPGTVPEQGAHDTSDEEGEGSDWSWTPARLEPKTIGRETWEKIVRHHWDFDTTAAVRRYVKAVAFNTWTDRDTGLPLVPWQMLEWIIGGGDTKFVTNGGDWDGGGEAVLAWLHDQTSLGPSGEGPAIDWNDYKAKERCRTIETIGLHPAALKAIEEDAPTDPDRVYVQTGNPMHENHGYKVRTKWEERLEDEAEDAPSEMAARVLRHMNGQSSKTTSKITDHVPEALRYVQRRSYEVDLTWDRRMHFQARMNRVERIKGYQQRFDRSVVKSIAHQHKPFYRFSPNGRTDRIFSANHSVLILPSDVRKVLCQDYHEIDLKSAHLMIAAWLWGADRAKAKLQREDYSVWDDLERHYGPLIAERFGTPDGLPDSEWSTFKGALKGALYSVVFGMNEANVKGNLTRELKPLLGEETGAHFGRHKLIRDLLDARQEQFIQIQRQGGMKAAGGRRIDLRSRIKVAQREGRSNVMQAAAAKVLGTVAQSYEMELMSVLVDYEQDLQDTSKRFKVAFWLHDGAYVQIPRSIGARMKDLDVRLEQKAEQLGVHARFEHEPIEPPN
ncbi:hypothetical protein GGQ07_003422 [Salinibacter ruber]|uniref:hypothetical protein n=1 Tax=Salinibacter ruber TaxID=146919 RepID=UPI00216A0346|nr:hypothetical protein [Salinibacter ruber]MCS4181958.1 hypothetical protein [Salinibacter ruber]